MTRFLSDALQADEPQFRLGLRQLETANGGPSTDIRLSTEILHQSQSKLAELHLDPHDTTAAELYHALQLRVADDDARLIKTLRTQAATHISAEADVAAGMVRALKALPDSKSCFAIKASKLKSLLEANPPKRAMKTLGYRSMKSYIKHEHPALSLAAGWLLEGDSWHKKFLSQYKSLESHDFESRTISILEPTSKSWRQLAQSVIDAKHHTVISFKEFGAIIILPMDTDSLPPGSVTATLTIALHELNEIRAASTFLKLNQVRPEFGKIVQTITTEEPKLHSVVLNQEMPWNLIQRYYSRIKDTINDAIFEPYLQLDEMNWYSIEKQLCSIDPQLKFWQNTSYLALIDAAKKPVSMNIVDAALNYTNKVTFENRIVQYFQKSLWHELLLRYLKQDPVEEAVLQELQPAYAENSQLA